MACPAGHAGKISEKFPERLAKIEDLLKEFSKMVTDLV